ncbi:MAG: acireductone synthase [Acidobacteria bacterium]|nr:acireductone synthase [Acidobacteriota bacterium]
MAAVLLDIEGTTTPLAFVRDVLFPFARAHLTGWIARHHDDPEFRDVVSRLAAEHAADRRDDASVPDWRDPTPAALHESVDAYARWLMDRDRKSPGLKLLQGLIWEEGFKAGELRGEVFADVPRALRRWRAAGLIVAIYSSGSELAQRRLFGSAGDGDLSHCIAAYFDTAVGSKRDSSSFTRIARLLGTTPGAMLFVSDIPAELAAARAAGCQVVLSVRPGNPDDGDRAGYEQITTFDGIA